jgi:hypothetical protein
MFKLEYIQKELAKADEVLSTGTKLDLISEVL